MSFFSTYKNSVKAFSIMFLLLLTMMLQGAQAKQTARPKVIEFYASWCEPCRRLQPAMDRVRAEYGTDVEFERVNVDDPASRDIVEKYGVCPIPTVIFEDAEKNVKAYAVGCTEDRNIQSGISKILM